MIYDISQELFSCHVFPGDPAPERKRLMSITDGDMCNLTALSMGAHNGTHVDAPYHFIENGKTIDAIGLEPFVGECVVVHHEGDVSEGDARRFLETPAERLLIAGHATVTEKAAAVFAKSDLLLLGNESQTVGPEDSPANVHRILLGKGIVLLEGIALDGIKDGRYLLSAAPLNIGGCDGAPCRAYLMDLD